MGTIIRAVGPIHDDYRWVLPPGTSSRLLTPTPDETALADQNDATYFHWQYTNIVSIGGGTTEMTNVLDEALEITETAVNITGIRGVVRVSYQSTRSGANVIDNGVGFGISRWIPDGFGGWEQVFDLYSPDFPLVADGLVYEHSYDFSLEELQENDLAFTWETFREAAEAGLLSRHWFSYSNVFNDGSQVDEVTIHEAWFEVLSLEPAITGDAVTVRRRFT